MKRLAIAICVVVLVMAVAVLAQRSVEQELIKIENGWSEAMLKKDIAFFEQILADDYIETDSEGNVLTKAQAIAGTKSGEFAMTSAAQENIKVRLYGDAAVVTGRSIIKMQYKGKDVSGQYQWTDTFIKRDGRWLCVASHNSRIPQK